jgi:hypothetical protein
VIDYYDRQGNPLTTMEWARMVEKRADMTYKRVATTTLPDGKWVSTVWVGYNQQYGEGPPLIFETMVFRSEDDLSEFDCDRYSTEAEAVEGHARMVAKWSAPGGADHDDPGDS